MVKNDSLGLVSNEKYDFFFNIIRMAIQVSDLNTVNVSLKLIWEKFMDKHFGNLKTLMCCVHIPSVLLCQA